MKREEAITIVSLAVRRKAFQIVLNAGSGHLGGCSSSAELMSTLYFGGELRFDPSDPRHPGRDRVLVRGHLGPLRYALFALLGWVRDDELTTYRSLGSRLQGHESMHLLPGVDLTPSGSLGMLLSFGVGSALALRDQAIDATTWVFLGDGEEQEGNVSEAARHAAALHLDNLVCIIDQNGKQLSKRTDEVDAVSDLGALWTAYGWHTITVPNGHCVNDVLDALQRRATNRPTAIVARTEKGHGLAGHDAQPAGYHTLSSCPREVVSEAIDELANEIRARGADPDDVTDIAAALLAAVTRPAGVPAARTRLEVATPSIAAAHSFDDAFELYLRGLVAAFRGHANSRLYVLTADWIAPRHSQAADLHAAHIRFIDAGIREQHMIACAHGLAATDPGAHVIVVMGDAFVLRASDQLHAIAQSASRVVVVGTDAGICESRNGATHQSTGQPGAIISMPGIEFFEPADAHDLRSCLDWAIGTAMCPVFVRLHSGTVEPLACNARMLGAYVAHEPASTPQIVLIGSGLPVADLVDVAKALDAINIGARVVNVVAPKRLDAAFTAMLVDGAPALTVYNGNPDVLASAVSACILAHPGPRPSRVVRHGFTLGTSGQLANLARHFRLDAQGIAEVLETCGIIEKQLVAGAS